MPGPSTRGMRRERVGRTAWCWSPARVWCRHTHSSGLWRRTPSNRSKSDVMSPNGCPTNPPLNPPQQASRVVFHKPKIGSFQPGTLHRAPRGNLEKRRDPRLKAIKRSVAVPARTRNGSREVAVAIFCGPRTSGGGLGGLFFFGDASGVGASVSSRWWRLCPSFIMGPLFHGGGLVSPSSSHRPRSRRS